MPDNWTFVAAAYTVAALAFGTYWRWLGKKEREINALRGRNGTGRNTAGQSAAVRNDRSTAVRNDQSAAVRIDRGSRSQDLRSQDLL
jgi:hypothetical protein